MANGMTHSVVGGLSGLVVTILDNNKDGDNTHNPLLATSVGTLFGKFPDILEPAQNNPHHRQFFHSLVVLAAVGYGLKKAYKWQPKDNFNSLLRGVILFAGAGYISHLLLDAATPQSLPIMGKI